MSSSNDHRLLLTVLVLLPLLPGGSKSPPPGGQLNNAAAPIAPGSDENSSANRPGGNAAPSEVDSTGVSNHGAQVQNGNSSSMKKANSSKQLPEDTKPKVNAALPKSMSNAIKNNDQRTDQAQKMNSSLSIHSADLDKQLVEGTKPIEDAVPPKASSNVMENNDQRTDQAQNVISDLLIKNASSDNKRNKLVEGTKPEDNAALPKDMSIVIKNNDQRTDQLDIKLEDNTVPPKGDTKRIDEEAEPGPGNPKIVSLTDQLADNVNYRNRKPEQPSVVQPVQTYWFPFDVYAVVLVGLLLIIICAWRKLWHCIFYLIGWIKKPNTRSATEHASVQYKRLATK